MNDVYQVIGRTRTDASGRYFFTGIPAGRFLIRVLPLGTDLEEQSQDVEIVNLPRPGGVTSDHVFKDFYLRVRRQIGPAELKPGIVFAQEVPEEARKLYKKGVDELNGGQRESGIRSLVAAAQSFPEYYEALDRLGREYLVDGNLRYARAVFTKMVSVYDRSFPGWLGLGYSAQALGETGIAIEALLKATRLRPDSVDAFLQLGRAYRQAKNFLEAERALKKANGLSDEKSAEVHWNLALLYGNNLERYAEAANELDEYLKLSPAAANAGEVRKLIVRFKELSMAQSK